MKLVSGLALASASLLSVPACAAAHDPAPGIATDAQGVVTLTGAHHLDGAAFSLIVTDWWLTGTAGGPAPDVRLVVEVQLPSYPLLDHATDAAGRKLDVVILARGPSARWPKKASERVAVVLPRDYADKARTTGLDITVFGKDRSFPVAVPGEALAHFLDSYAQAASKAAAAPTSPPPTPVPAPPVAAPASVAQPAPAPAAPPPVPAAPPPAVTPPPVAPPPVTQAPAPRTAPPAAPTPQAAPTPEDDDPAITPLQDKRVRLPNGQFAPTPPSAPPPAPTTPPPTAAPEEEEAGGHGTWVDALGLEFVATSSGAMVLTTKPGSIAAAKGIQSGDFIEGVDGVPIKTLDAEHMAARIGAPGVRVLHMIVAGDVKLR